MEENRLEDAWDGQRTYSMVFVVCDVPTFHDLFDRLRVGEDLEVVFWATPLVHLSNLCTP